MKKFSFSTHYKKTSFKGDRIGTQSIFILCFLISLTFNNDVISASIITSSAVFFLNEPLLSDSQTLLIPGGLRKMKIFTFSQISSKQFSHHIQNSSTYIYIYTGCKISRLTYSSDVLLT